MALINMAAGVPRWHRTKLIWSASILLILSVCFVMGPAMAVLSAETEIIEGRVPTASGYLTILQPDGATLIDKEAVSLDAKPNEFTLGPLSSGLTVTDIDGDAPLSMAVSKPEVTWTWRASNGTPLTAAQLAQPFSTSFASGSLLSVMVSAPVASTSVSGTPRTGTETFVSQYFVTLKPAPTLRVNGVNFAINSGFPKTGFLGARFQIYMNGTNASLNNKYTYFTTQPWALVDSTGVVTFNRMPTSAQKTVTVSIRPKAGVMEAEKRFSFTLNRWFVNSGGRVDSAALNDAYCTNLVGGYTTPEYATMTNSDRLPGTRSPTSGQLWPEWGALGAYLNGWVNGDYWALEPMPGDDHLRRHHVNSIYGSLGGAFNSSTLNYAVCSKPL